MKIERVDDKTVKCYLSNEELEEYEIDYKDFITRSEKAKEIVQEIMEQAMEEVGYQPPQFAFDLQIMMVPEQGLVLTFSEKEPFEGKEGSQIMDALKEMKKVLLEAKAHLQKGSVDQASDKHRPPSLPEHSEPAQMAADENFRPEAVIFAFSSLRRVILFANVLPANMRLKSALYVLGDEYFLHLQKGSAAYERFSKTCVQAVEYGTMCAGGEEQLFYLQEHGECLIKEKALKKLREQ